jgi:hypothetical protein
VGDHSGGFQLAQVDQVNLVGRADERKRGGRKEGRRDEGVKITTSEACSSSSFALPSSLPPSRPYLTLDREPGPCVFHAQVPCGFVLRFEREGQPRRDAPQRELAHPEDGREEGREGGREGGRKREREGGREGVETSGSVRKDTKWTVNTTEAM